MSVRPSATCMLCTLTHTPTQTHLTPAWPRNCSSKNNKRDERQRRKVRQRQRESEQASWGWGWAASKALNYANDLLHRSKWQAASGKWQVAIQPAVWQTGNMAAWRYALPKRMAKNKSRQIVQLQSKASQLAPAPHSPSYSSCSAHCVADFGSKWHGHICRFTGPVSRPASVPPGSCSSSPRLHNFYSPNALATPLLHVPQSCERGQPYERAGLHILATTLARTTATTAGRATTDNGKWLSCLFDKLMLHPVGVGRGKWPDTLSKFRYGILGIFISCKIAKADYLA